MNPFHLSKTNEHFTPSDITDAARKLMGGIDLDPATCDKANENIQAKSIYTIETNGLIQNWQGNVWLNPPGSKLEGKSLPKLFWQKLIDEYDAGRVKQAVFLAFSIAMLSSAQTCSTSPTAFPICIPKKRIKFISPEGISQGSPTHASGIIYLPPKNIDYDIAVEDFISHFSFLGDIMIPKSVLNMDIF